MQERQTLETDEPGRGGTKLSPDLGNKAPLRTKLFAKLIK